MYIGENVRWKFECATHDSTGEQGRPGLSGELVTGQVEGQAL